MNNTTFEKFAKDAFDIELSSLKELKPVNVHEANIGVLARNFKKNCDELTRVEFIVKKPKSKMILLKTESCSTRVGEDHLFYNGKDFIFARLFKVDDLIQLQDSKFEKVIEARPDGEDDIYDIETALGNYYTDGILSHNTMMSHAIQTTGGYALKYAASTMNRVKKIESLKEGSKEVGIHMNVRNYKNKTGIPWRECDMDLYFKGGFDSTCEYVDFIKDLCADSRLAPLCTAGAGGTFKSEKFQFSIRGRDNMIDWAKKDHPGWEEIKKVINEIISGNNNMDENRVNPDEDDNVSDEMKEVLKADKEAEEEHQPTTLEEVPIAKSKKKKADLDDTAGEPLATTEDIPDIKMND